MGNWEKKSSYLLREIVKFRTYIDTLQTAQGTKEKNQEDEEARRGCSKGGGRQRGDARGSGRIV